MNTLDSIYEREALDFGVIAEISSELLVSTPRMEKLQEYAARYFEARAENAEKEGWNDVAASWRERAEKHRKAAK